jgi:microsomal dipeptidase-like Zn-dependent dipeptidase
MGKVTTTIDTSQLNLITNELLKLKFSTNEIEKIMGDNVFRVLISILE